MANENEVLNDLEGNSEESFDFDELEEKLNSQLEEELAGLEFLEEEKKKIGNPETLGKVIMDEVWKQFGTQIGLDITNETLIEKYDKEHPEQYDEVGKSVMQDQKYKDANKAMKEKQQSGELKDEYTGKHIKPNENANLDHVESRKEIYESQRRKQAGLRTEELANKPENLKPTSESLNKSKGAKSVEEYTSTREEREKRLKEQNQKANKKVDESNMSDAEKRLQKEKNNKRLQDKLDADDELMKKADREARKAINKDINKGAAKEIGKKAGKDALKEMAVSALFALLKDIMNGLVRFFKSKSKSFKAFLEEMKKSIKAFISKIGQFAKTGASSLVGSVLTEIFDPILDAFKNLTKLIKQGVHTVIDAVKFFTDKEYKDKPFSVKIAKVCEILTGGVVAGGASFLSGIFKSAFMKIPGMQIQIPMLGTLANIVGLFLASLISGIIGAVILNLIERFIAQKQKQEVQADIIESGNQVIATHHQLQIVNEALLESDKEGARTNISSRHQEAGKIMKDAYRNIMEDFVEDFSDEDTVRDKNKDCIIDNESVSIIKKLDSISGELDDLLK